MNGMMKKSKTRIVQFLGLVSQAYALQTTSIAGGQLRTVYGESTCNLAKLTIIAHMVLNDPSSPAYEPLVKAQDECFVPRTWLQDPDTLEMGECSNVTAGNTTKAIKPPDHALNWAKRVICCYDLEDRSDYDGVSFCGLNKEGTHPLLHKLAGRLLDDDLRALINANNICEEYENPVTANATKEKYCNKVERGTRSLYWETEAWKHTHPFQFINGDDGGIMLHEATDCSDVSDADMVSFSGGNWANCTVAIEDVWNAGILDVRQVNTGSWWGLDPTAKGLGVHCCRAANNNDVGEGGVMQPGGYLPGATPHSGQRLSILHIDDITGADGECSASSLGYWNKNREEYLRKGSTVFHTPNQLGTRDCLLHSMQMSVWIVDLFQRKSPFFQNVAIDVYIVDDASDNALALQRVQFAILHAAGRGAPVIGTTGPRSSAMQAVVAPLLKLYNIPNIMTAGEAAYEDFPYSLMLGPSSDMMVDYLQGLLSVVGFRGSDDPDAMEQRWKRVGFIGMAGEQQCERTQENIVKRQRNSGDEFDVVGTYLVSSQDPSKMGNYFSDIIDKIRRSDIRVIWGCMDTLAQLHFACAVYRAEYIGPHLQVFIVGEPRLGQDHMVNKVDFSVAPYNDIPCTVTETAFAMDSWKFASPTDKMAPSTFQIFNGLLETKYGTDFEYMVYNFGQDTWAEDPADRPPVHEAGRRLSDEHPPSRFKKHHEHRIPKPPATHIPYAPIPKFIAEVPPAERNPLQKAIAANPAKFAQWLGPEYAKYVSPSAQQTSSGPSRRVQDENGANVTSEELPWWHIGPGQFWEDCRDLDGTMPGPDKDDKNYMLSLTSIVEAGISTCGQATSFGGCGILPDLMNQYCPMQCCDQGQTHASCTCSCSCRKWHTDKGLDPFEVIVQGGSSVARCWPGQDGKPEPIGQAGACIWGPPKAVGNDDTPGYPQIAHFMSTDYIGEAAWAWEAPFVKTNCMPFCQGHEAVSNTNDVTLVGVRWSDQHGAQYSWQTIAGATTWYRPRMAVNRHFFVIDGHTVIMRALEKMWAEVETPDVSWATKFWKLPVPATQFVNFDYSSGNALTKLFPYMQSMRFVSGFSGHIGFGIDNSRMFAIMNIDHALFEYVECNVTKYDGSNGNSKDCADGTFGVLVYGDDDSGIASYNPDVSATSKFIYWRNPANSTADLTEFDKSIFWMNYGSDPLQLTYERPLDYRPVCPAGKESVLPDAWDKVFVFDVDDCQVCKTGYYKSEPGRHRCSIVPPGFMTSFDHTKLIMCRAGQFSPGGVDFCRVCPAGSVSTLPMASRCQCDTGYYESTREDGVVICQACPYAHQTTEFRDSKSEDACICGSGFYHPCGSKEKPYDPFADECLLSHDDGRNYRTEYDFCKPCMTGFQCHSDFGMVTTQDLEGADNFGKKYHKKPDSLPGYWAQQKNFMMLDELFDTDMGKVVTTQWYVDIDENGMVPPYGELDSFDCANTLACPGGLPLNECPSNRYGFVCFECQEGFYFSGGSCEVCTDGDTWPLFVISIGITAMVIGTYFLTNGDVTGQMSSTLATALTLGNMAMACQYLSAVSLMGLMWSEPWASILESFQIFAFDINIVRMDCVVRVSAAAKNVTTQIAPAFILGIYVAFYILWRTMNTLPDNIWPQRFKKGLKIQWMFNTVGQVWQVAFTAIALNVSVPANCYSHPNGETSSMRKFPGVICGSDEHRNIVFVAAICSIFYLGGYLAICYNAILQAPEKTRGIGSHRTDAYGRRTIHEEAVKFLQTYRFLFYRFTPHHYQWGIVILSRNAMIAFVQIIATDNPTAQILVMSTVLLFFLCMQCYFWPWRSKMLNVADTLTLVAIWCVVCIGSVFNDQPEDMHVYGVIVMCIFMLLFLGILFMFFWTILEIHVDHDTNPNSRKNIELRENVHTLVECMTKLRYEEDLTEPVFYKTLRMMNKQNRTVIEDFVNLINQNALVAAALPEGEEKSKVLSSLSMSMSMSSSRSKKRMATDVHVDLNSHQERNDVGELVIKNPSLIQRYHKPIQTAFFFLTLVMTGACFGFFVTKVSNLQTAHTIMPATFSIPKTQSVTDWEQGTGASFSVDFTLQGKNQLTDALTIEETEMKLLWMNVPVDAGLEYANLGSTMLSIDTMEPETSMFDGIFTEDITVPVVIPNDIFRYWFSMLEFQSEAILAVEFSVKGTFPFWMKKFEFEIYKHCEFGIQTSKDEVSVTQLSDWSNLDCTTTHVSYNNMIHGWIWVTSITILSAISCILVSLLWFMTTEEAERLREWIDEKINGPIKYAVRGAARRVSRRMSRASDSAKSVISKNKQHQQNVLEQLEVKAQTEPPAFEIKSESSEGEEAPVQNVGEVYQLPNQTPPESEVGVENH